MAALNFPNSPSVNDIHTENGVSFKWNGTIWKKVGASYLDTTNLNVTGIGTFAGAVNIGGVLTYEDVKNVDSVGIITARTGLSVTAGDVVIPDKIVHAGDTNTAIRFPEADNFTVECAGAERFRVKPTNDVAVFTGSNSGTLTIRNDTSNEMQLHTGGSDALIFGTGGENERVRITSAGDVGIGYNSPTVKLHVREGASGFSGTYDNRYHIICENSGEAYLGFYVPDNSYAGIRFHDTTGSEGYIDYYMSDDAMHFYSTGDHIFKAGGSERLHIYSSGNVNFGALKAVAFPSGTGFQVYHSANPRIKLSNDATGFSGSDGTQLYLSSTGDTILDNKDSKDIIIHTNAAEKLRIKNTGNIGIGTVNPQDYDAGAESLVVCGPGGTLGQSGITIVSGSGNYGCLYFADGTGSASYRGRVEYRHDIDVLQMGANGAHGDLVLDSSGNLFLRGDQQIRMVLGSSGSSGYPTDNNSNWIRGNANHLEFNCCTGGYQAWEIGGSQKMKLNGSDLELVSASSVRITLGSDGTPGSNNSNWVRGDSNNLMFNCADTSGEHIFEVAGTAKAKISPGQGVRAENTCKAWICYKHDGGVSAIHDSFFVTSATDESTGIFTVNFEGDMGTEDAIAYQVGSHNQTPMAVGGVAYTPSYGGQNPWWSMEDDWVRINLQRIDASGSSYIDTEWWNLIAFGDAI